MIVVALIKVVTNCYGLNAYFDLVSVLYHSLEGARTYAIYMRDCADDQELEQFFRQIQQEEVMRADGARQLLAARMTIPGVGQQVGAGQQQPGMPRL